jgi:hypothetical protein
MSSNTWVEVGKKKGTASAPSALVAPSTRPRRRSDERQPLPKFWPKNRSRSAFWNSRSKKEKKEIVDDWKAELSKSIKTKMVQPIDIPQDVQDAFRRYRSVAKAKASSKAVARESVPTLEEPEKIPLSPLALLKSDETTETCPEVVLVTSESSKDKDSESTTPANVKVIVPSQDAETTSSSSDVVTRFKGVLQPLWMAFGYIVLVRLALVENSWLLCLPSGYANAGKKSASAVPKLDTKKILSSSVPPNFELAGESLLTSHGKFDLPSVSSLPTYAPELRPEAFIASILPSL